MKNQFFHFATLASLLFAFFIERSFADSVRSKIQIALDNVRIAMSLHAGENDGRLPAAWDDFSLYIEEDALEEFSNMIILLTAPGTDLRIEGKRLLAISRTPNKNGEFEAIHAPPNIRDLIPVTREQLREIGLDPTIASRPGSQERQSNPALREDMADGSSANAVSGNAPPFRWNFIYAITTIALLGVLIVLRRITMRK